MNSRELGLMQVFVLKGKAQATYLYKLEESDVLFQYK